MGNLVSPEGHPNSRRFRSRVTLVALLSLLPLVALEAQEPRDTLVMSSTLTVPDSVPLTFVLQLVAGTDGSVFLLDALTDGVLAFDSDGVFQKRLGRRGEGPGELLSPWRLGLVGQDTLWVADATTRRVNLYDVSTGTSLGDLGPVTLETSESGRRLLRPFAVLADHRIVAVDWGADEKPANLLAFRGVGRMITGAEGLSLSVLDPQDRVLAVPVPAGGGGLQMRNPFSHSDMLAIDPLGGHVVITRRPQPDGSHAVFTVERHNVLEDRQDSISIPYSTRRLEIRDVRAWAEAQGAVREMVEMGVFPSRAAGVEAVMGALERPEYFPPVRNRGRGMVEEGVLVDSEGVVWFGVPDLSRSRNEWLVLSRQGQVSRVSAPVHARLLAVQGDRVWAEVRDRFGVPTIHVFRVGPSDA